MQTTPIHAILHICHRCQPKEIYSGNRHLHCHHYLEMYNIQRRAILKGDFNAKDDCVPGIRKDRLLKAPSRCHGDMAVSASLTSTFSNGTHRIPSNVHHRLMPSPSATILNIISRHTPSGAFLAQFPTFVPRSQSSSGRSLSKRMKLLTCWEIGRSAAMMSKVLPPILVSANPCVTTGRDRPHLLMRVNFAPQSRFCFPCSLVLHWIMSASPVPPDTVELYVFPCLTP